MTIYERDMAAMDPNGSYPRSMPVPITTANGVVYKVVVGLQARLLTPDRSAYVGSWFYETAAIDPDVPVVDQNGRLVLDVDGNVTFEDHRLSGGYIRRSFFCTTGIYDTRLIMSTNKTGMTAHVRGRR